MSRLEDEVTGKIKPQELYVEIPAQRVEQAQLTAQVLGDAVYSKFPFVDGTRPVESDLAELVLNRTWRPALAVTGLDGIPALESAGNVMRPFTAVKLSLRLPPTLDGTTAGSGSSACGEDPPNGAKVHSNSAKRRRAGTPGVGAVARRPSKACRARAPLPYNGEAAAFVQWACREISRAPDHRSARPAIECARSERSAHSNRKALSMCVAGHRGPSPGSPAGRTNGVAATPRTRITATAAAGNGCAGRRHLRSAPQRYAAAVWNCRTVMVLAA